MPGSGQRSAILVQSVDGQPSASELARQAARGDRPRKDYVELARELDAAVIDTSYMAEHACAPARLIARRYGLPAGQIAEAFLRQRDFRHLIAWGDRLGLPLALLYKVTRGRRDLLMLAQWTSRAKKATFLRPLGAHSHIRGLIYNSRAQLDDAAARLGVPRAKLHHQPIPVDSRFWSPEAAGDSDTICSVGVEGRDYPTLIEAIRDLNLHLELAVASPTLTGAAAAAAVGLDPDGLPAHVRLGSPGLAELRALYARSRFVVLPLQDRDYEVGSTVVTEALAMGRAVIMTRTRGQHDLIVDGEHGLLVPPGDSRALRSAIAYLASHPDEAERMGRAGRALVEERHSLDRFVARVAALAREIRPLPVERPLADLA